MKRTLGRSGIEVSGLGAGCWAIGGPFWAGDLALGWGKTDDQVSKQALEHAFELGINFFDTADVYGAGHSERLIAEVFEKKRDKIVIATKLGNVFDEDSKQVIGQDASPEYMKKACKASLKRLRTDYIDLYQFHINEYAADKADEVRDTLETLVQEGCIRHYCWSTDFVDRAEVFAKGKHCTAVQHEINVLKDNNSMIELVEQHNLASINRGPLAMGLLSGKYKTEDASQIQDSDVRHNSSLDWLQYFKGGMPSQELLIKIEAIKEILQSKGRTLVQGALAWLWARSPQCIPIPGFRTAKQIAESVAAMEYGPLDEEQMDEIAELIK